MTSWTDIEQKACADALTDADVMAIIARFAELEDVPSNAQAMALAKKFKLDIHWQIAGAVYVSRSDGFPAISGSGDVNRAIIEYITERQKAKP